MQYTTGNLWEVAATRGWVVVTTNTTLRRDGSAVMGAGLAKEAVERYPGIDVRLGKHINVFYDRLYIEKPVICLPTKRDWKRNSRMIWIEKGCHELVDFGRILKDLGNTDPIYLPKLGCGLGGLNWEREVRPVMDAILEDDRFVLVSI